jgi:spore maturation protein CgeB
MAEMLKDDIHCAWYHDLDECSARCRHFLSDESERRRIRAQGEEFVRANHTYDQRVAFLLEDLEWVNPH